MAASGAAVGPEATADGETLAEDSIRPLSEDEGAAPGSTSEPIEEETSPVAASAEPAAIEPAAPEPHSRHTRTSRHTRARRHTEPAAAPEPAATPEPAAATPEPEPAAEPPAPEPVGPAVAQSDDPGPPSQVEPEVGLPNEPPLGPG